MEKRLCLRKKQLRCGALGEVEMLLGLLSVMELNRLRDLSVLAEEMDKEEASTVQ